MIVIVILYLTSLLLFKAMCICEEKKNCLDDQLLSLYDFTHKEDLSARLKRSTDHVTPEEALRIKNESSVIVERLISLGKKAHKLLHHLPDREGDILLKTLTEYNVVLEQFLELIKHDNINTRKDVDKFLGQQHPNIAETDHLEWDARTRFNWAAEDYKQFEDLMYNARQLWIELIHIYAYY